MARWPIVKNETSQGEKVGSSWFSWLIALTAGIWLVYFLAFQFARITQFPIGDDPAVHVANVKTLSYRELARLNYPLPIAIYKYIYTTTSADPVKLFPQLISFFLFTSALALGIFAYKSERSVTIALAAAIMFVTGRWVNDYLRMGTIAEVFGWGIMLLTLYALASNRLILTFILTGILAISHPFSLLVYVIIATIYLLLALISKEPKERTFAIRLLTAYALTGIAMAVLQPARVHDILVFKSGDPIGWGERTFWEIISSDDIKRIFIPILSLFGLIALASQWKKPIVKILYIFFVVSFFLSVNQVLSIHFLAFRFYAYLEMALAIFAAVGLSTLVKGMSIRDEGVFIIVVGVAILFALPSYFINQRYLLWQKTDPNARAIMTQPDLTAMAWIDTHVSQDSAIAADSQHSLWIAALTNHQRVAAREWPYDTAKFTELMTTIRRINDDYIYYPATEEIPDMVKPYGIEVYSHGGVKIYRVNHAKN
jgi:hypothetical protein